MAAKRTQPALYELMGERAERAPAPREPDDEPRFMSWLGAGRSVRLPAGYVWLGSAVVVVLIVAAFSLGFVRGRRDAETQYQRDWLAMNNLPIPPPEVDPTSPVQSPAAAPGPQGAVPASGGSKAPDTAGGPGGRRPRTGPASWGPVSSDPRQAGLNYFVLLTTNDRNATAFAQFCRDHGVEAYVITANNSSFARVIALPGYKGGDRGADEVRALEARIDDVARKWKLQINPRDDLAYYPEKFNG